MKNQSSQKTSWLSKLGRFKKVKVLVVGDILHDVFIWGRVKRISPEAPVPVVEVTRETSLLGGAANVANNVVALGAKAALAGVIGSDAAGEAVIKAIDKMGVDRRGVRQSKWRPTPVKTRIIAQKQQVVRYDREDKRPMAPETFKALMRAIGKVMDQSDAVIVSDYAKGVVSEQLMERLKKLCVDRNKVLVVDPKPEHAAWYCGADIITPNNKEASQMAGFEIETAKQLEDAGKVIIEKLGCRALLITRGEQGMSLFQPKKKTVHVKARTREVYDVTGAGDTVIGALTVALAAGMSVSEAVELSNLAAGIVVGKLGTSVASVDEIKAAVNNPVKE